MKNSLRHLFPFLDNNPGLVYLDSAASAQKPAPVIRAMVDFMERDYSNIHRGLYPLAERAGAMWERAREKAAEFLGAAKDEIVFTRGATAAINLAARALRIGEGDKAAVGIGEHHSNLLPWTESGARVEFVKLGADGRYDLDDLRRAAKGARVVAIAGQSNVLGALNDVRAICDIAHEAGALAFIDAAQMAAHARIDVRAIGADMLAFSAHKIYGPTGIGVLFARRELLDEWEPVEFGGDMVADCHLSGSGAAAKFMPAPQKFEAGTMPLIEAAGLTAAIDFIGSTELSRAAELSKYAYGKLAEIRGWRPISPSDAEGIISFNMDGVSPFDLASVLAKKNICIRAGHHCAQPLHEHSGSGGSARASFGIYNTEADADALASAVAKAAEILK